MRTVSEPASAATSRDWIPFGQWTAAPSGGSQPCTLLAGIGAVESEIDVAGAVEGDRDVVWAGSPMDAQGGAAVDALGAHDRGAARLHLRPFAGFLQHRVAALGAVRASVELVGAASPFENVVAGAAVEAIGFAVARYLIRRGRADHVLEPAQGVRPVTLRRAGGEVDGNPLRGVRVGGDVFAPGPAIERVVAEVAADDVAVARPAAVLVAAQVPDHDVAVAFAAFERVVAEPPVEVVGARAAFHRIVAAPAEEAVVAAAAVDRLVDARPP